MKATTHNRPRARNRERATEPPLALFHAPLPGEEVELFSDRNEDQVEYEAIMHEFESLHDAESAG